MRNVELKEVFKIDKKNPDRLVSRESSSVEFKESFSYKALPKYAKTMAAFANCKGGYIIFGVKDSPRLFPGLDEKRLEAFKSIDPQRISGELNNVFAPEIKYESGVHSFKGRQFGFIKIFESQNKPVMASKCFGEGVVTEGAIYYRYRGRSQLIKYPELRQILDDVRKSEQLLWMRHLAKIAKVGVRDVGIFDFKSGMTTSSSGRTFLLDEAILGKVAFVKEGSFSETSGIPTLRIIGDVQGVQSGNGIPNIIREKGIHLGNIVSDFLNQKTLKNGLDYLQQICFETSGNLPCYFYIHRSGCSLEKVVNVLNAVVTRCPAKRILIERLLKSKTSRAKFATSKTKQSSERKRFVDAIRLGKVGNVSISNENDAMRFCQAVQSADRELVLKNSTDICSVLNLIFIKYFEKMSSTGGSAFRMAVCWVDEVMYKGLCK